MGIDKEQVREAVETLFKTEETVNNMIQQHEKETGEKVSDEEKAMFSTSNRGKMWDIFAEEVHNHIEHYTIPQYGDFPIDLATTLSEEHFKACILKYVNRLSTSSRGDMESNQDLIKIAHYAQLIWAKRLGFEDVFNEYLNPEENNTAEEKE